MSALSDVLGYLIEQVADAANTASRANYDELGGALIEVGDNLSTLQDAVLLSDQEQLTADQASQLRSLVNAAAELVAGEAIGFGITSLLAGFAITASGGFIVTATGGVLLGLTIGEANALLVDAGITLVGNDIDFSEQTGPFQYIGTTADDSLTLGGAPGAVDGWLGFDEAKYADGPITMSAGEVQISGQDFKSIQISHSAGVDQLVNFEKVVGTSHADSFLLSDIEQSINLDGGDGDDFFTLGGDNSGGGSIEGGGGLDTITYFDTDSINNVDINLQTGIAMVTGELGSANPFFTVTNIENVSGTDGRNTLVGNQYNNAISGLGGDDILVGGAGRDLLDGGEGADVLQGGLDGDTYYAGAGDTISGDDGNGDVVYFDGVKLGTAERSRGEDCSEQDPGPRDFASGEGQYTQGGFVFEKVAGGLQVTSASGTLLIEGWSGNGNFGISLLDIDPRTGDPCDFQPYDYGSPLVLDLDLDGLEITSVGGNSVYFDLDNDGIRERTAWVGSDDGLLVLDRNDNGTIDNGTELFGYGDTYAPDLRDQSLETYLEGNGGAGIEFTSGFGQLAEFDLNADGEINSSDAVYSSLRVWRDLNNDGVSQDGEMFSLSELDIESISLEAVRDIRDENGSQGTDYSSFTYGDGRTSTIADIWFQFDQYDSQFDAVENIDDAILALPDTIGGGDVDSLRNTMAQDATLADMVSQFATTDPTDFAEASNQVNNIIMRWTGVSENLGATFRGRYADAREVAVMEAFADTDFDQWGNRSPLPEAGAVLSEQYDVVHRNVLTELVLQTEWGAALFPELSFDRGSVVLNAEADFNTIIARIGAGAPEGVVEKAGYYNFMLTVYDRVFGSFTVDDGTGVQVDASGLYVAEVEAMLAREGLTHSYNDFLMAKIGDAGNDDILTDSWDGNQYGSKRSIIVGGEGADTITTGAGQNTIYYSKGDGFDSLVIDQFSSAEWAFLPRVELRLVDIDSTDVEFARFEGTFSRDVLLKIVSTGEQIRLLNFLDVNETRSGTIFFADDVTMTFDEVEQIAGALAEAGTELGEIIIQSFGDTLEGGGGDDRMQGAEGDTNFVYNLGDGDDEIIDIAGVGTNQINFGPGITLNDLTFTRIGSVGQDLIIIIGSGAGSLTIRDQFAESATTINQLSFTSGDTLSATQIADMTRIGTSNDELLHGTNGSDKFYAEYQNGALDGAIFAPGGNDTMTGYDGSDDYHFGSSSGDDIIQDKGRDSSYASVNGTPITDVDVIHFQQDLSDLSITRVGDTFTFVDNNSGATLTVINGGGYFRGEGQIERFTFGYDTEESSFDVELSYDAMVDYIDTLNFVDGRSTTLGTSGDDVLDGTDDSEIIIGSEGNDEINGLGGDDLLVGNEGNDTIDGGAGEDRIEGGSDNDILSGGTNNDEIFGGSGGDQLNGNDGDDRLFGESGNDEFTGGAGDDLIVDSFGAATVFYNVGDGNDIVFVDASTSLVDAIVFGAGISASDLTYEFVRIDDLDIPGNEGVFSQSWGVKTTILGGAANEGSIISAVDVAFNGRNLTGFDEFQFADLTTLSTSVVMGELRTATDDDQTIAGTGEDDFITGGGGNDTLYGLVGLDTYVIRAGDESDTIVDTGAPFRSFVETTNSLSFEDGITLADLTFSRSGDSNENLIVKTSNGDHVTILGQFGAYTENDGSIVNSLVIGNLLFDDGSSIGFEEVEAITTLASAGNDLQIGTEIAENFATSAGDDTMIGGFGGDSYEFGIGSGADKIIEVDANRGELREVEGDEPGQIYDPNLARDTDTLTFGDGVTIGDLIVNASGSTLADVTIQIAGTADVLTIENQLLPNGSWGKANKDYFSYATGQEVLVIAEGEEFTQETWDLAFGGEFGSDPLYAAGIENFVFADGSSYGREEIAALIADIDNSGDNDLSTGGAGGILDGGAGDDALNGGTGDDTYVFGYDYDSDVANDAGGDDQLQFTDTVEAELISFRRVGDNGDDLLIELGGTDRNALLVENQFAGDQFKIEEFVLADGSKWTADQIERYILSSEISEGSDTIRDFDGATIINARGGDDRIILQSGADLIDGGTGRDTVVLSGSEDDYQITVQGAFTYIEHLAGVEGIKMMVNVEVIEYSTPDTNGETVVVDLVENIAPTVDDLTIDGREDTSIIVLPSDIEALGDDADGSQLQLISVQNAVNGTVELNQQGRVVFTPDDDFNGIATFEYTIVDSAGAEVTGTATVNVESVNDAPVVGSDNAVAAIAGLATVIATTELLANDSDIDGDVLSIASLGEVSNGTALIDVNGNIEFTAAADFVGTAVIQYFVSDGTAVVETFLAINVEVDDQNSAPVLDNPIADQTFNEDGAVNFTVPSDTFSDTEGDALALSALLADGSPLPTWLAFDGDTGSFVGMPPANFNGILDIQITASDGEFDVSDTFVIDVTAVNDAPTVAVPLVDQSFDEDTLVEFTIPAGTFNDIDGDALSMSATRGDGTALPVWLSFDGATGTFTGTPPANFNGDIEVEVTASDGELEVSDAFTIDIAAANDAPIVAVPLVDQNFDEDTLVEFTVPANTFSDIDGNVLSLSATLSDGAELPTWLSFDGVTGMFTGTPPANFNGSIDVAVTASDGELETSDTFTIEVASVNDAPMIDNALVDQSFEEESAINFAIPANAFADVDGDNLALSVTLSDGSDLPGWLIFDGATGSFSGNAPTGFVGSLDISVTASDGEFEVSDDFSIAITESVDPGTGDSTGFSVVAVNDWYNASWGGGFIVTFEYDVTSASIVDDELHSWLIDAGYSGSGTVVNAWMDGFNGPTTHFTDDGFGIGNTGLSYVPELTDGDTLTVSFQVDGAGFDTDDFSPTFFDTDPVETPSMASDIEINAAATSDWGTGFQQDVEVENISGGVLNGWSLLYDTPDGQNIDVNNVWGATVEELANGDLVFTAADWNSELDVGETVSFGFTATDDINDVVGITSNDFELV